MCIPELNVELSFRLSDDITIFTAELVAIKLALMWLNQNIANVGLSRDVVIFSDSLSALSAIKAGHYARNSKMVNEVHCAINEIVPSVILVWIPSHVGIKGNERVDRLAQSAIRNTDV